MKLTGEIIDTVPPLYWIKCINNSCYGQKLLWKHEFKLKKESKN